jgi:hypothetical protein
VGKGCVGGEDGYVCVGCVCAHIYTCCMKDIMRTNMRIRAPPLHMDGGKGELDIKS